MGYHKGDGRRRARLRREAQRVELERESRDVRALVAVAREVRR